MRRIALLGGTFDPIHVGHLHVARAALERFAFDAVRFLPAPAAPHKTSGAMLAIDRRVDLLRRACADDPRLGVETYEVERGGTSFTIDTLEALHARDPDTRFFFLIGGDSLRDLPGWRRSLELVERFTFVTVPRDPAVDRAALLAPAEAKFPHAAVARLRFHLIAAPPLPMSSTEIRERLRTGDSIAGAVPETVLRALPRQS